MVLGIASIDERMRRVGIREFREHLRTELESLPVGIERYGELFAVIIDADVLDGILKRLAEADAVPESGGVEEQVPQREAGHPARADETGEVVEGGVEVAPSPGGAAGTL